MNSKLSYKRCLEKAMIDLKNSYISNYEFDALEMLLFVKNIDRSKYIIVKDTIADSDFVEKYFDLISKRKQHIPLQHLLGFAWFYGRRFIVNKNVLIPRFETEVLCEKVIELIQGTLQEDINAGKNVKVLDLCTGSGCIAITLKKECENIDVYASDISKEALMIAKDNAVEINADVSFIESDLFENISDAEKFDIIVSNPPYISANELESLDIEVKDFDPRLALTDFGDGLTFYKKISESAGKYLNQKGHLVFEIGSEQGEDVKNILQKNNYCNIKIYKDLTSKDRVVVAQKI